MPTFAAANFISRRDASVTRLQDACAALLYQVLATPSLLEPSSNPLSILDVGFGCGDQTWELARLVGRDRLQYVGVTNNAAQMRVAKARMARELGDGDSSSFSLFLGDAAAPATWDEDITATASRLKGDTWLLGLDCLYHFKPSRKPLLRYAAKKLGANFMAFDLLLNEKAGIGTKILARLVCRLMGCPGNAFLTPAEYAAQLIECGYDGDSIVLRDISEDVFPGFVAFMKNQETSLQEYGIKMGALKYAGKLFGWFHSSGAVRATIVVARVDGAKKNE